MKETTLSKPKQRTTTKSISSSTTRSGMDMVSIACLGTMGAVSAFIGTWALFCFTAALTNVGPVEMVKSFFSALIGM